LAVLAGHGDWVNRAVFSPDGSRIVTASFDNTARVWDGTTGTVLAKLSGHTDRVYNAAFSPEGSRIVTASADNTARVWDATTGAALATLSGHTNQVVGAVFSADGSRIVTASLDRSARVWRLDPIVATPADQRRAYVCRERLIGARSLTDEEMHDPILRGREDLRDPCARVGPLSPSYYWRAAAALAASVARAFSR